MIKKDYIESYKRWVIFSLSLLYLLVLFTSAWLCDDSFITFRTVDNFTNGYGLTWNISERVQTYTHPLWMFIISFFYSLTSEIYFTSLIVSIIISVITFLLVLYKISVSVINSILAASILILSKAFVDYSTSGLENPLTHLLIVLFSIVYFTNNNEDKKLFTLSLIACFAMLTRMDNILLFLPLLIASYLKTKRIKGFLLIISGFLPFVIWEFFSIFYYGFPIPNTAYAKLNTGINQVEYIEQGFYYLVNSLYLDPISLVVIITGLLIVIIRKNKSLIPLLIGIGLYLIYIIKIGGDFMSGRFLSSLIISSTIIIAKSHIPVKAFLPQIAAVIILGLLSPKPTIFYNKYYSLEPTSFKAFRFGPFVSDGDHGIIDERIQYYKYTGLLNNISNSELYDHPWAAEGLRMKNENINYATKGSIGFRGFYAGPDIYIIDPFALSDPLLSKLPVIESSLKKSERKYIWKIGHLRRDIPAGYVETLKTGTNKIEDENLKKYYSILSHIVKGDLFDVQRLKQIIYFNLGKYDYLIEEYEEKLKNSSR